METEKIPAAGNLNQHPLSKNQQKKRKRDEEWEAGREARKVKRKGKAQLKKERKRTTRDPNSSRANAELEPPTVPHQNPSTDTTKEGRPKPRRFVHLPVTFILDCGFDDLMTEKERKSLGSQVTRCYSDNHKAPYQANLAVSSFGGHLKERFDSVLSGNYQSWKNIKFSNENFVDVSESARTQMSSFPKEDAVKIFADLQHFQRAARDAQPITETIYLSSDSPHTLTALKPYSTYIIGGLVDRNRHKGICYKRAMDAGIKTAKLPIGDYMKMTSRYVLATNHVAEIMLRWLECGDWGKAFLQVIPQRKGGTLLGASECVNPDTHSSDSAEVQSGRPETEVVHDSVGEAFCGHAGAALGGGGNKDDDVQYANGKPSSANDHADAIGLDCGPEQAEGQNIGGGESEDIEKSTNSNKHTLSRTQDESGPQKEAPECGDEVVTLEVHLHQRKPRDDFAVDALQVSSN